VLHKRQNCIQTRSFNVPALVFLKEPGRPGSLRRTVSLRIRTCFTRVGVSSWLAPPWDSIGSPRHLGPSIEVNHFSLEPEPAPKHFCLGPTPFAFFLSSAFSLDGHELMISLFT
jgi:hypothetical protein